MTLSALSAQDFEANSKYDSLIVDCRAPLDFIKGFIPSAVYLAPAFFKHAYLKDFFNREEHLQYFIVAEEAEAEEKASWIQKQSSKKIEGYLQGGFQSWEDAAEPIDVIISIEPDEIMMDMKYGKPLIADIRSEAAFDAMHVEGAEHTDPENLLRNAAKLKPEDTFYLYCEDGSVSLSLISILKHEGYHNFYHLQGGFKALFEAEATMVKGS